MFEYIVPTSDLEEKERHEAHVKTLREALSMSIEAMHLQLDELKKPPYQLMMEYAEKLYRYVDPETVAYVASMLLTDKATEEYINKVTELLKDK